MDISPILPIENAVVSTRYPFNLLPVNSGFICNGTPQEIRTLRSNLASYVRRKKLAGIERRMHIKKQPDGSYLVWRSL